MKPLAMVLKIEAVTDSGIETLRQEEDMEYAAKAINAYPKLVAALRCIEAKHALGKPETLRKVASEVLREIGESA